VVAAGVPAVFVETTINPRTIEAMIEAVRAQGRQVTIGGALFSDAMGAAGTPEGSYVGMIRHNTRTIVTALGGTPAPWPAALAPWATRWGLAG
jgi:manganese/zinc/iron transport system substrate-binding protein